MNLTDYAQFGIAIFTVGALVFCIEKFLKFMEKQEESFKDTIDNHLNESAKIATKQLESAQNLNKAVEELLTFLRYSNGRHKKDKH
jgi:hypothetical protein